MHIRGFARPDAGLAVLHLHRQQAVRSALNRCRRIAQAAVAIALATLAAWVLTGGIKLMRTDSATATTAVQVPLQAMPPGVPLFDFHNWR